MNNSDANNSPGASDSAATRKSSFSLFEQLKGKRISYLTLPLIVMATITEFVILSTGWKYQQVVCLPQGMGVTFFGIGPIGATILAVELLKLPLAIWTASRSGFQKWFMLIMGLPLICLLTFQLVKDMAVYEMGVALAPAEQLLKAADKQEIKIDELNGELAAIDQKKTDRDAKLVDLTARKAKANADLQDSLKLNQDDRQDAISLTDYQKHELSDVADRQSTIIRQFDADAAQINQAIADLQARRQTELAAASEWNAAEARIENDYKSKMIAYNDAKAAYEKAKAKYDNANVLERQFMKEPVDPGVPPERQVNTVLKPTALAQIDEQIKAKEAELAAVNNQRRDRVAQVEDEANHLRQEFDNRSTSKREDSDRKREQLLAGQTALATQFAAEEKQINSDFDTAALKVDDIRAQLDAARSQAEQLYEARVTAIENTQVHRIATTVEIIRGLFSGKRPVSVTISAKDRGDLYTDQISMVRIWVYPVLAFIVAFLPTLMVEIGFSTIFKPEQKRASYRIGWFGRRLHELYIRAGRQKILRAERLAGQSTREINVRERALAEKEAELQAARQNLDTAAAGHLAELQKQDEEHAAELKVKNDEWVVKLAGMADSLNRAIIEKDALRDLQKSEVERQIQMRQNAWSDRLTLMRQELDEQRNAAETERTAMMQAQQKKLLEVTEDCKNQVIQARRQAADAELAVVENTARLTNELREALLARDTAEAQMKQQSESLSLKLSQAREEAAREFEKTSRQEKHRWERQQQEFAKTLRQREEDAEHKLKQREQELELGFEGRLAEQQAKLEQDARRQLSELEHQLAARALEVDARWKQDVQAREEAAQIRIKQREQQLQAQMEARLTEANVRAEQELRHRESELERRIEAHGREASTRLTQELQQKELVFQARLKQREQELTTHLTTQLTAQAEARQTAAQLAWGMEAEKKTLQLVEPLKAQIARFEKERDEARQTAADSTRQVQHLEKKLMEASSFLSGWRNGNGNGNGNGKTLIGVG